MSGNDVLDFGDCAAMDAVKTLLDQMPDIPVDTNSQSAGISTFSGDSKASPAGSSSEVSIGQRAHAGTLLVAGAPGAGKTEFALAAALVGISQFGDTRVFMAVSGRRAADKLSDRIIRAVGSTSSARPVTTLSAIAFRLLSAIRESNREPLPKLLNGAEQDALLRQVVAVHVRHARSGELCDTCELMRQYFAADDWVDTVYGENGSETIGKPRETGGVSRGLVSGRRAADASSNDDQPRSTSKGIGSSDVLFARGINDAFVMQLRDMLARMDELGLGFEREDEVLRMLADSQNAGEGYSLCNERLGVQWRLAFALRREYVQAVVDGYPGEFRLDSSRLLVEGARVAAEVAEQVLPKFVVVDDFQDLTLAGLAFLEALTRRGVKLLLVGNPDEAVQTFRGSYPEYLFARAQQPPLSAGLMTLPVRLIRKVTSASNGSGTVAEYGDSQNLTDENKTAGTEVFETVDNGNHAETVSETAESKDNVETVSENGSPASPSYLDLLASRVSLSIAANEETSVALPDRPGKLPRMAATLPIAPLDSNDPKLRDGSVTTLLYRNPREELDDVVWRIKEAHLSAGRQWNDFAVIAHDNDTVRAFGERLRGDGVPVRYSAVTKPLKDDPSVQGLFALLELAKLRHDGIGAVGMSLSETARYVRSRVQTLLESPLVSLGSSSAVSVSSSPARLAPVESVMKAIASLAQVVDGEMSGQAPAVDADEDGHALDVTAQLPRLQAAWRALRNRVVAQRPAGDIEVDNSLVEGISDQDEVDMPFGLDAMYIMLAFDGSGLENDTAGAAEAVLQLLGKVGGDAYTRAFAHVWNLVDKVEKGLLSLPSLEPQYALSLAWDASHVASAWQVQALANNADGRAANDRLDVMMRLFAYASGSGAKQSIEDFISSVRSMRIEADSLAKVAPIDQAVTLTTPAGAAGGHWRFVFITEIQQDVWPNLAARNTMFGGEDLADIVLHGGMREEHEPGMAGGDRELAQVLSAEQKSFLVALTRASEQVSLSAVLSDDTVPSDFLYTYVPERFDRMRDADLETRNYTPLADSGRFAGLDTDPRGLVAASRIELMRQPDTAGTGTGETGEVGNDTVNNNQDVVGKNTGAYGVAGAEADSLQSAVAPDALSSARVRDAAASLALLDDAGLQAANPDSWPYTFNAPNAASASWQSETAQNTYASDSSQRNESVRLSGLQTSGNVSDCDDSNSFEASQEPRNISHLDESATFQTSQESQNASQDNELPLSAPTVTLSPSQVDRIWACPVCWMLENQFAGPRPSNAATSFGTLVHKVAQLASEAGLDAPDFMSDSSEDDHIKAITTRMMDMYHELADDLDAIDDPEQRYRAESKDEGAEQTLTDIATYFVTSNDKDYPYGNLKNFTVGHLQHADSEYEFAARFGLDDIRAAYNAIDGINPIDTDDLVGIMGVLNGGWPEGMSADLQIRLTGRIDRMEWRDLGDGKEHVRLIDWKTGHGHSGKQMFNDLQLVCYQLGLAFPEANRSKQNNDGSGTSAVLPNVGLHGVEALKAMPDITQSALFDVDMATSPAQSYGAAETVFQPTLFHAGTLNSTGFTKRSHYSDLQKLADLPDLPADAPQGVSAHAWEQFLSLRGTQAVWALTMISRIFYAAAASRSSVLVARPQPDHVAWCNMKTVCPACAGEVDTVYEVRRG
ncbi:PD-(D/E)XK nuclease family protein [Bifidobacterium sp. ESL0728]|uniref:PD-(D/E)XK nuclease family protein n=1 Tax=Bifidobacterium sp. ESL0728 TaxID=2983220 RepID=UPI0023FA2CDF|nr:PD-(D/E)XK nuclease family protein [Bifidobacterium sp. ESL0728]WEV58682.1 PD-(D/E)XK nuclease family protein [Bifidobacterium sp. ESL0728]